jgi:hypothetical protein
LLEYGVHPPRVGHLELAVQVDLVVDRVDEAVQALARVGVEGIGDDGEGVLLGDVVELDPHAVTHHRGVELASVQRHRMHRAGDRVDEGRRSGRARERHGGSASEGFRTGGEVERDVVVLHAHQPGALPCFYSREVFSWHGTTPSNQGWVAGTMPRKTDIQPS